MAAGEGRTPHNAFPRGCGRTAAAPGTPHKSPNLIHIPFINGRGFPGGRGRARLRRPAKPMTVQPGSTATAPRARLQSGYPGWLGPRYWYLARHGEPWSINDVAKGPAYRRVLAKSGQGRQSVPTGPAPPSPTPTAPPPAIPPAAGGGMGFGGCGRGEPAGVGAVVRAPRFPQGFSVPVVPGSQHRRGRGCVRGRKAGGLGAGRGVGAARGPIPGPHPPRGTGGGREPTGSRPYAAPAGA